MSADQQADLLAALQQSIDAAMRSAMTRADARERHAENDACDNCCAPTVDTAFCDPCAWERARDEEDERQFEAGRDARWERDDWEPPGEQRALA